WPRRSIPACARHLDAVERLADSGLESVPRRDRRGRIDMTTEPRTERRITMPRRTLALLAALAATALLLVVVPPGGAHAPTTFRSALVGEPPHIDPQRMADFGSYTVASHVYSTLTILDDKLQIVPYTAEKWTVSRDGLTWTFKLRDNVYFHNGRKADAN